LAHFNVERAAALEACVREKAGEHAAQAALAGAAPTGVIEL